MHSKLFPFYKISLLLLISFFIGCGSQPDKSKKPEVKAKKVVVKQSKDKTPPKAASQKPTGPKENADSSVEKDASDKKGDSSQASEIGESEEEVADIYDPTGRIDPFAPLVKERKFVYRTLGDTGIKLPVISMGVMNANNPNLVKAALDAGIVFIDTAHYYQNGSY